MLLVNFAMIQDLCTSDTAGKELSMVLERQNEANISTIQSYVSLYIHTFWHTKLVQHFPYILRFLSPTHPYRFSKVISAG